jgi:hypothetical protein
VQPRTPIRVVEELANKIAIKRFQLVKKHAALRRASLLATANFCREIGFNI